jgi:hypothetical protein
MAVARWRQARLWALQTATLDIETERQPLEAGNEPVRVALAFQSLADHSNTLTLLLSGPRLRAFHRTALAQGLHRNRKMLAAGSLNGSGK